ncbi:MAG: hypothetical protein IJ062_00895 [Firmicutes bacterium]|nr:hypothetical protein [Bacillota bacterium]
MKRAIFFLSLFFVLLTAVLTIKTKKNHDVIVFEMSHMPGTDDNGANIYFNASTYYALKDNNELVWVVGRGNLGDGTYGSYFYSIREKGYVYLTDDEAKQIKEHLKYIIKYYRPSSQIYYEDMVSGNSSEFIIKTNNNYYTIADYKDKRNDKKWEEHAPNYFEDERHFFSLEKEIVSIINEYHKEYKESASDYIYDIKGTKKKNYDDYDYKFYDYIHYQQKNESS